MPDETESTAESEPQDLVKQRLNVFAFRLGGANGFGAAVALALQLLGIDLQRFATLLELAEFRYIQFKVFGTQSIDDILELAAQYFWIKHG